MAKLINVLERAGWTFVQAFAAAATFAPGLAVTTQIKIAAGAGAIAVLKTLSIESTVRAGTEVRNKG